MNRLLTLIIFCSLATISNLQAQDPHFSQFYSSPLSVNPALTGSFNGLFRATANYRDQWSGALESPYVTYSVGADVRFDADIGSKYRDAIAIGMLFFSDRVNLLDFNSNQLGFSGAFHKSLDYNQNQVISLGFQASIIQRGVNYETFDFEDEFNGTSGYDGTTGEALPPNNFAFGDLSVGLNYALNFGKRRALIIGGTMHHITSPRISFYEPVTDQDKRVEDGSENLYTRYSGQLALEFPIARKEKVTMLPRAMFSTQGPHQELSGGTNFRFALASSQEMALQVGGWLRNVKDETGAWDQEAVAAMVGFELSGLLIGISHDFNLSGLENDRRGQNAIEISISYIGEYEDDTILCPSF